MSEPARLTIRPLAVADLPAAADLLVASDLCRRDGLPARLTTLLEATTSRCLAADENGHLVGVLLASSNAFHLFLSHLAVAASHCGAGVGARLHDELMRIGRREGAQGIVVDSRLSAVGFFQRMGYRTPGAVFLIRDLDRER